MRSPAGLGSWVRRARKHAAATTVEALAGAPGPGRGTRRGRRRGPGRRAGGRRARRRAGADRRSTPGGCSGRWRPRRGVGRSASGGRARPLGSVSKGRKGTSISRTPAPGLTRRPPPAGTTSPARAGEGELVRLPSPDPPPVEPNQSVARERARPASGGPPANGRVARRGRAPLAAEALRLTESPLIRPNGSKVRSRGGLGARLFPGQAPP